MIKFKYKNVVLFFFILSVVSIVGLVFVSTSEASTAALKAAAKKQNDPHKAFFKWANENKSEVYRIAPNMFACNTYDHYAKVYNKVRYNNGNVSIAQVKKWNGYVFKAESICRILEHRGNVVKVRHTVPRTRGLTMERWIHIDMLQKVDDYRKGLM